MILLDTKKIFQLRAEVINNLKDYLPEEHPNNIISIENAASDLTFSSKLIRGLIDSIQLTAKQIAANQVLYLTSIYRINHINYVDTNENIKSIESNLLKLMDLKNLLNTTQYDAQIHELNLDLDSKRKYLASLDLNINININNLITDLDNYVIFLTDQEAKPFKDIGNSINTFENTNIQQVVQTIKGMSKPEIASSYTPRNAVGKLAVKAAIEIEKDTLRRASVKQVMDLLRVWAEKGFEPDILNKIEKNGDVVWITTKLSENKYGPGACEKILQKWNKGRL